MDNSKEKKILKVWNLVFLAAFTPTRCFNEVWEQGNEMRRKTGQKGGTTGRLSHRENTAVAALPPASIANHRNEKND